VETVSAEGCTKHSRIRAYTVMKGALVGGQREEWKRLCHKTNQPGWIISKF